MIQYFQLTPEILLEYKYVDNSKLNDSKSDNVKNICGDAAKTMLLKSNIFSSKYLCFKNESEGFDSISNLVLPLNNTETQFVVAKSKYQNFYSKANVLNRVSTKNGNEYMYIDTNYDADILEKNENCNIKYDKCVLHFTSRNYFGSYESLIFQAYIYLSNKSKLYFASFQLKGTSNVELKSEHLLHNGKLYTTQIEFDIPNVSDIVTNKNKDFNKALYYVMKSEFQNILSQDSDEDIDLSRIVLQNTPICINIYGVSGTIKGTTDNYEKLKTLKLNSISIPYVYNRLDEISVKISEAEDGDYYYINPEVTGYGSFVEYINSMGEDIRSYMVMHELLLEELFVTRDNVVKSEITHKEYHIIDINEDDEDTEISERFDAKIKYRPICIHAAENWKAKIIDKIKIINTVDNTSYEVCGEIYIDKPNKYGKKLKTLNIETRPIVNVYNKKVVDDNGGINNINLNRGGGFVIENNSQNITSFIECTNIGVSVTELSPDEIN